MRNSNDSPEISDVMIACANSGLFPLPSFSHRVIAETPFASVLLNHFEKRAYQVRHPGLRDLSDLIELETACWPGPLRMPSEELKARIERFPSGHCLMERGGRVVGAIHSQRITAVELLKTAVGATVSALHREDGPIVQLLAVTIHPEMRTLGLGDELLEFMLQYASIQRGVERVVAVSLCKEYPLHASIPMDSYIQLRDEFGHLRDPILRFHESHGGRITGLCPGYRPLDLNNRGNGVLVEYDILNRRPVGGPATALAAGPPSHAGRVGLVLPIVEDCVRRVMRVASASSFSSSRPLMEMGLDSLKLMELRSLLSGKLRRELDAAFFFRYGTPERIARFFEDADSENTDTGEEALPILVNRSSRTESGHPVKNTPETRAVGSSRKTLANAVAIVGMACKFPGECDNAADYWKLIVDGTDAITEIPGDRWEIDRYYDADPQKPGKIISRHGGFLRNVDRFDAPFFNISPREAAAMDPQQRLLLTLTWEAIENAGINPAALAGTRTGVFAGLFSHDYETLQIKENVRDAGLSFDDTYFATGNSTAVAAGRLAYFFGFQGPALAIDTACSSSLVAVHLACRSLRQGETDMAIAAGVNLLLSPELSITFSRAGMLSRSGRCKAFDASADGYVRSEGCGVVVLKRLSRAIADGDVVLAVLRGSAINQDGASNGLTAPNGLAQEAVIRTALADAGVSPRAVSYVEAHGTGTQLGDPVEISSLATVYGEGRNADNPLFIGSVKANIGHTEAAAGIAGLIKVVLAMRHRHIPMQPHFRELNPLIALDIIPATIPVAGTDWKKGEGPLLAGVSAFGFSGTNAHVVVEEAPGAMRKETNTPERPLHLLTLSARTAPALTRLTESYAAFLDASAPEETLADICYTANTGRAHFNRKIGIVGKSKAEISEKLHSRESFGEAKGVFRGEESSSPPIAFLFTGQGAQFAGMGKDLYATQPTFRRALDRCHALLEGVLDRPLLDVIYPAGKDLQGRVDETAYTQPALFAIEYALCELWKHWGVEPGAVIGHSVGEYAAACAAGVFSLEEGLKLIAARGRLMQALPRDGAMAAVFAEETLVMDAIRPFGDEISVAAINGPRLIVISGLTKSVETVTRTLASGDVKVVMLNVSHAFHSRLMEPVLDPFGRIARELHYAPPAIDLISNLTGESIGKAITAPDYWVNHVRGTVRFAAGMETLYRKGYRVFVEIGPHPVLAGMAGMCLPPGSWTWLPSLHRGKPDWEQLLGSLGALYTRGAGIDWQGFDADYSRNRVPLPTYPFESRRYWIGTTPTGGEQPVPCPLHFEKKTFDGNEKSNEVKDLLYRVTWHKQALASRDASNRLPSPLIIKDHVSLPGSDKNESLAGLLSAMEDLSVSYVQNAFSRLGWPFAAGSRFTTAEAAERLRVTGKYRPLLGRLLSMLAEEGTLLPIREDEYEMMRDKVFPHHESFNIHDGSVVPDSSGVHDVSDNRRRELHSTYPGAEAELTLLGRCGAGLAGVLRGEVDPLDLLFPEADLTMATRLYEDSPTFGPMNRIIGEAISAILTNQTGGQTLRILEIGAGTGGTTAAVLSHLMKVSGCRKQGAGKETPSPAPGSLQPPFLIEYVFTDVSAHFLSRAKERFAAYPFVRYQLLDIEKDPIWQGFRPHDFDVVLAANVLHATADLRYTLQQVKKLLSPGALLVLLEGIHQRRWLDMIFGLLDGWWKFKDHNLRPSHPLIGITAWEKILTENGFTETAALSPGQGGALFEQAVILGKTSPDARPASVFPPRHWLLLSDTTGVGAGLSRLLGERGDLVTLAFTGERFAKEPHGKMDGPSRYTVNPQKRKDFRDLLSAATENTPPLDSILHLWGLDAATPGNQAERDMTVTSLGLCTGMLHLVQSLVEMEGSRRPSLRQVTRHAVCVDGTAPLLSGLSQAPLWGMAQVIAAEHPELNCVRIDIDPGTGCVSALLDEILHGHREDRIALRGDARYSARLTPFGNQGAGGRGQETGNENPPPALCPPPAPIIRSDSAYLISGGLGGTGLQMARRLVALGAGQIILFGRGGKPAEGSPASEVIRQLERSGTRIVVLQADVSQRGDVAAVLNTIGASGMPLKGIIHAAGVFADRLLADHEEALFKTVFAAKVTGAWNLHELTRDIPLDFFVLFSSATSFVCSAGLGNYVAANAFLDALAHYRRRMGLPGLSIDWGPWTETGMAEAVGKRRAEKSLNQWAARGLDTLVPETALSVFQRLLGTTDPQVVAMPMDWQRFFGQFPHTVRPDFFDRIPHHEAAPGPKRENFYAQLTAAPADQWRNLLSTHIRSLVADVLGLDSPAAIDIRQGFFQMGMDSLTSMELRNRLQKEFSRPLSATLIFKFPTVESLADHLHSTLVDPARDSIVESRGKTIGMTGGGKQKMDMIDPDALSEKEAEALLIETLEKLGY
ncbi:MAG: SDR family NAD(P)-dependent oxidoreductase [Pseudomonadota bacterium]